MTLRLGVLGLSPGNGHPYSWSAICNGYDPEAMSGCGFPVIPEYLARQTWPNDRIPGVLVTHVWTQDRAISEHVAKASLVGTVVNQPEEMIGEIDALLLARDDAQNHRRLAQTFLSAGLPVYIDKPIALSEAEFDSLHALQVRPGQIFSCSALRFAREMQLDSETAERIGPIQLIQGTTPKYWNTYGMHLIDPILAILGYEEMPHRLFSGPIGADGRFLALRWPRCGPDVHLMATGTGVPSPLSLRVVGSKGEVTLIFSDSFQAFKSSLMEFVTGVREGQSRLPEAFNRRAAQIIEMGIE